MAAIAGVIGTFEEGGKKLVSAMLKEMAHRGKDKVNYETRESGIMGVASAELSPERGEGIARHGNVALVLDGELYNSRAEGMSDAEFALQQYRRYGRGFARYLEGAFACAVLDAGELLLVRDSVGVRPLYYGRDDRGSFCFASEMKALTGLVEDVFELLPGTVCSNKSGVGAFLHEYPEVNIGREFEVVRRQVRDNLVKAVEKRLADGAVGACLLSGGLDSSIIASIAHQLGFQMPLLTVGMEGAADVENAKIMADYLGMEHHICTFGKDDILAMAPRAVKALESFDEDCVSGTITNLIASEFASRWTNCILSGEGGDELFGGYHLLKDVEGEGQQLRMMEKLVAISYNTALQRLDRSMMAAGIHYRTPFLDDSVVALALQTPVSWKIHQDADGEFTEKYILREAFQDILPDTIYERVKLRFAAGAGTDGMVDEIAAAQLDASEFERHSRSETGYELNSLKELWYYRIFRECFPGQAYERLVGRWDPFK